MDGRVNVNLASDPLLANFFDGSNQYKTSFEQHTDNGFIRPTLNGFFFLKDLDTAPAYFLRKTFRLLYSQFFAVSLWARQLPGKNGQSTAAQYFGVKGLRFDSTLTQYGLKQSRRSRIAMGVDRQGNPRMSDNLLTSTTNELIDSWEEVNGLNETASDSQFSLAELESVLRQFDHDSSGLPQRLKDVVKVSLAINRELFDAVTTRSVELRHPNMAAISRHVRNYGVQGYPRSNSASSNFTNGIPSDPRQNHASKWRKPSYFECETRRKHASLDSNAL